MTMKDAVVNIISDTESAVKAEPPKKIKVTVRIPDHLHERVRQQKVNRIYDILNPEKSR